MIITNIPLSCTTKPQYIARSEQESFNVLTRTDRFLNKHAPGALKIYENTLKDVFLLSPEEYYKPEGIDFLQNGDMIIGSEGMKKGALQGKIYVIKRNTK